MAQTCRSGVSRSGRLLTKALASALLLRPGIASCGSHRPAADDRMVLEVLTDARQVLRNGDAEIAELSPVADARQHQDLRRVNGTRGQHNLTGSFDRTNLVLPLELHARHPAALHRQTIDVGTCQHRQVGLVHDGIQILRRQIAPAAVSDANVGDGGAAGALLHDSVLVVEGRNSE